MTAPTEIGAAEAKSALDKYYTLDTEARNRVSAWKAAAKYKAREDIVSGYLVTANEGVHIALGFWNERVVPILLQDEKAEADAAGNAFNEALARSRLTRSREDYGL